MYFFEVCFCVIVLTAVSFCGKHLVSGEQSSAFAQLTMTNLKQMRARKFTAE
jgi:hypothetical protein